MAPVAAPVLPITNFPFSPQAYPGRRPRFSFLFTSHGIYRCPLRSLSQLLADRHLSPIGDRYAILAYGSNSCPGQLSRKNLTDVPVLFGHLEGAEAVYARRMTKSGYVPATLARKRGRRPSWLTLLTGEQVQLMDHSEGRPGSYVLASVPDLQFRIGQTQILPLYSYVDICAGVMIARGRPVSLRSVSQRRAKLILESAVSETAEARLDFVEIPFPRLPQFHAKFFRTARTGRVERRR
jgi:hypothetical protein